MHDPSMLPVGGVQRTVTVFTYLIDHFDTAPLLAITSPTFRCGKTTLLAVIGRLVFRPLYASNISPPAVYRTIEKARPTLIVDEADTFLNDNFELRGVLNSGHTRTAAYVIRNVQIGDDFEPRRFSTWSAKIIAKIGKLPATLADRAIPIRMDRKARGDKVERMVRRETEELFDRLRQQIRRWTHDVSRFISDKTPELPSDLNDRAADNWLPLLSIAESTVTSWVAGDTEISDVAREAAKRLSQDVVDDIDAKVTLLGDIRRPFGEHTDRLTSEEIVSRLVDLDDRPWSEWSHGKPLTKKKLADLLSGFQIRPAQKKFDGTNFRGYLRESFADAWRNYPVPGTETDKSIQEKDVSGSGKVAVALPNRYPLPNGTSMNDDNSLFTKELRENGSGTTSTATAHGGLKV